MGRRLVAGGKIAHCWLDPNGEELLYDKVKAAVVGGRYEIDVIRKPDNGISVYKNTVKFVEQPTVGKTTLNQWQLEDKAAYTEQQRRAVERRVTKEEKPLANMTLAEVATMIRRAPSQRSAIIATVINEINYGDLWG